MTGFNPKTWTARFEACGGIVSWTGRELWTGVVRARHDQGAEAERMKADLEEHPSWKQELAAYARDRLRH